MSTDRNSILIVEMAQGRKGPILQGYHHHKECGGANIESLKTPIKESKR